MPEIQPAAYGMYPRNAALPEIVCTLNRAGIEKEDICIILSPDHPMAAVVRDAKFVHTEAKDDVQSVRTIGWFSQFGAVVIPAVGFFIRSQVFFRAMIEQELPILSESLRILAGLGFSQAEVEKFQLALRQAGALVYVACAEKAKAEWAIELLRGSGACDVAGRHHMKAAGTAAQAVGCA
jgi:hypothetical protein